MKIDITSNVKDKPKVLRPIQNIFKKHSKRGGIGLLLYDERIASFL